MLETGSRVAKWVHDRRGVTLWALESWGPRVTCLLQASLLQGGAHVEPSSRPDYWALGLPVPNENVPPIDLAYVLLLRLV